MVHLPENDPPPQATQELAAISTSWAVLRDPQQFVLRYGPAVRAYVRRLLPDAHDAEEVLQDFLLRVVQHRFLSFDPARGRFRDYLKASLRNAVISHHRRRSADERAAVDGERLLTVAAEQSADETWLAHWRQCLLDKAWRELDRHQRQTPGSACHSALRAVVDHDEEDSESLARRVADELGRPLSAEAFRKQLSRARRLFAKTLLTEVASTLDRPDAVAVQQELIDLGLWQYLRRLLPADWAKLLT